MSNRFLSSSTPIWITGFSRSGKTTRLVTEFQNWVEKQLFTRKRSSPQQGTSPLADGVLIFAANEDNRRNLADRFATGVQGKYPVLAKTPLGFFGEEISLFWPILFERLDLRAQFPLRLRPETEQELATQLWQKALQKPEWEVMGLNEYRLVRRILDIFQLAGASGTPLEDIPTLLEQGFLGQEWSKNEQLWQNIGKLLLEWRQWCLERGFLTYGLIYDLYWRELLNDTSYQKQLIRRYRAIFADDVDDYPAIARDVFEFLLDSGATGAFTYNPHGGVKLGLNADPNYLEGLATRCEIETLTPKAENNLGVTWGDIFVQTVTDTFYIPTLPSQILSLQETSRASLLRKTAEVIIDAVKLQKIQPKDIAVIAPGLDEIARYSLIQILTHEGISVQPLHEQRPLISSPLVRALLTLLTLLYADLGGLLDKNAVAEMLVVLSSDFVRGQTQFNIDPVRAGLLSDYCFYPDLQQPHLLPIESFPRWDRLGHRATNAYQEILDWMKQHRQASPSSEQFLKVIEILNSAIEKFFGNGSNLTFDQLSPLRELLETAQHYWQVKKRLQKNEPNPHILSETVDNFILLLRRGTITANAYPMNALNISPPNAVTLATIYQYRSERSSHRWQFWLDASSHLWGQGGAATLFAAPLFLREWAGCTWTPKDQVTLDEGRLQHILRDLLGRATEQVYLCHSDLAVNGTEQNGPLLPLVHAARTVEPTAVSL